MKEHCPVCNTELTTNYEQQSNHGMEESLYECEKCCLYSEQFAYGSTQINIGDFMTGFSYRDSEIVKKQLFDKIIQLGKLYAIESDRG